MLLTQWIRSEDQDGQVYIEGGIDIDMDMDGQGEGQNQAGVKRVVGTPV